jgi:hypothetical protein
LSDPSSRAPLFVDAFDLCEWLLGRFGDDNRILPRRLCGHALQLLEVLTLALKGRRREEHLQIADERLILVRIHLRLAAAAAYLSWMKALEPG